VFNTQTSDQRERAGNLQPIFNGGKDVVDEGGAAPLGQQSIGAPDWIDYSGFRSF